MNENKDYFTGNPDQFCQAEIEPPLVGAHAPCCDYYDTQYINAAREAEHNGDQERASTYAFLAVLTSFCPKFDTPEDPYQPKHVNPGERSLIPSDLSGSDVAALEALAPLTKDPALRARLFDLLWVLKKDPTACAEAAKQYILAAERLNTSDWWMYAEDCYRRGVYLASRLGRSKEPYREATESLQQAVKLAEEGVWRDLQFMRLLLDFRCCDPKEFAPIAARMAEERSKEEQWVLARSYWETAGDFFHWSGDQNEERLVRLAAAETYVSEAENKAIGPGGSAMVAATILQSGIEALRRAGAVQERIEELRKRLKEYQTASLSEGQTISTECDISKSVKLAREHVMSENLHEALFRFALGHPLEHPDKVKKEVLEQASRTPFIHLIGASIIDDKGRTTAKREPLWGNDLDVREDGLEAHAFRHARLCWELRAAAYIEPAREQILNDHHPCLRDLCFAVHNSPVVPPGHEGIFLRGIHAGFHGDFVVASHLLVPQLENSLRYILECQGVDVSNLMSDGTQPVKMLRSLFSFPELEQILGADMCFELRGHLIEKSGYDYRNRVSHGFVTEADCLSHAAVSIWWLTLRLCLIPIYNLLHSSQTLNGASEPKKGEAEVRE